VKNRKSFALLCQHFYPEMISTGMHMTELAERLSEVGWEITVYCAQPSWGIDAGFNSKDIPHESVYKGIHIVRVPTWGQQRSHLFARLLFALTFMLSVCFYLWHHRRDINRLVVTTNPPFLGLINVLFSRLFNIPYLLIVYDVYPNIAVKLGVLSANSPVTFIWHKITKLIMNHAATLVVIGRDMAEIVRQKIPQSVHQRILMIPNWSDERRVRPIPRSENPFVQEHGLEELFVVQYAGRMGRTHNLEPLVEAANLLRDLPIHFQLIGEGAKKTKLQNMVAEYGLKNVQFLSYQPIERLGEVLSAADLAVVCLDESFTGLSVPSKSYGIMASGTPILGLVDDGGEIGLMIQEVGCGIVLAEQTAVSITNSLHELIKKPERLAAMGQAGREGFLRCYTLSRAATAYNQAIFNLVDLAPETKFSALDSSAS
jgi:glycosyltransferase involved in cell wall biosynthesis